jgi:hypothetical protein
MGFASLNPSYELRTGKSRAYCRNSKCPHFQPLAESVRIMAALPQLPCRHIKQKAEKSYIGINRMSLRGEMS